MNTPKTRKLPPNNVTKKASNEWIAISTIALIIFLSLTFINWPTITEKEIILLSEDEMICIADNSEVYLSSTCSACIHQKEALGEYIELFNITDCNEYYELCQGITIVPTWIINGEKYSGYRPIEKLKELTGC